MDESNGQQCDGLTDNVSKGYKDGENAKYVMQDTNIRKIHDHDDDCCLLLKTSDRKNLFESS